MNKRLKLLDRYLSIWIFIAMGLGIFIGYWLPQFPIVLSQISNGTTNIPIAIGLILMMYPPLAKVKLEKIPSLFKNKKRLSIALFITWIIGPLFMFILANIFLADKPEYRTGLIIVGVAPCIAMVIVWNELAQGNREYVAGLVGINSIIQVLFFSSMAYFYLYALPKFLGLESIAVSISITQIAVTVGIYLGIPFLLGIITRYSLVALKGESWYERTFIPKISPITLIALLGTIVLMFSMKGDSIIRLPLDVLRISIPLIIFFATIFIGTFIFLMKTKTPYEDAAAISFTASGNNFELAIAVSIGIFGINSGEAFAGVIGPLVEVPALISLVKLALYFKRKYYNAKPIHSNLN
ncbi:MAG: ACR3 family arsenite efflux transporter [Bacteroidia bacterium]|nr:ACR3 family arsenite efflux transporter [Bacteroidia bacterium]